MYAIRSYYGHPSQDFAVASGKPRTGKRLLAVGTDCSVGKMYTALALEKEMKAQGMKADSYNFV